MSSLWRWLSDAFGVSGRNYSRVPSPADTDAETAVRETGELLTLLSSALPACIHRWELTTPRELARYEVVRRLLVESCHLREKLGALQLCHGANRDFVQRQQERLKKLLLQYERHVIQLMTDPEVSDEHIARVMGTVTDVKLSELNVNRLQKTLEVAEEPIFDLEDRSPLDPLGTPPRAEPQPPPTPPLLPSLPLLPPPPTGPSSRTPPRRGRSPSSRRREPVPAAPLAC